MARMLERPDPAAAPASPPRTDPITFEVLRHRLWQINDEQGRTIINVSGSPVAYEANDMNTVIADPSGATVFVGPYMTILVGPLSLIIRNAVATFGADGIRPGDMYITNDPWLGAVHQNDLVLVAPVHWQGEL